MTQAYNKTDAYKDVRECIRMGYSMTETANLTGVNYFTVRNWTADLRNVKERKLLTDKQKLAIIRECIEGKKKYAAFARENGIKSSTVVAYAEKYIKEREESQAEMGGFIAKTIDMENLNVEQEGKKGYLEQAVEQKEEKSKQNVSLGGRISLNSKQFDFEYAIDLNDDKLEITSQRYGIKIDIIELPKFANELLEIAKKANVLSSVMKGWY